MIKAVLFDLDDTLISERQYIESGYSHIAKILSKEIKIEENIIYQLLFELFEKDSKNVFNRLFDKLQYSYTQDIIKKLVEEYRNHYPKINFIDGVIPTLEYLKRKKIKTGIITDGFAIAQRLKLEAIKANNYFDKIIVNDEIGRKYWKPHPRAFEIMKENMDVEYEEMIYVGDNPEKDFHISSMYPIKTIRFYKNGIYNNRSYYNNVKENYSIHNINEIITIINNQ